MRSEESSMAQREEAYDRLQVRSTLELRATLDDRITGR